MGPMNIKLPHLPKLANENRRLQIKEDRKSVGDKLQRITDLHNEDAKTIKILQWENDEMKKKVKETEKALKQKEQEHTKWIETMEKMTTDIAIYKQIIIQNLQREEEYKKRLKEEERKTKDAEEAKLEALARLNKEMGTKLNDNNLAIADLSDPNRATKLAEMYSEIYDNEWTELLEKLKKIDYTEEKSIRLLLDIVKKADEFCKKKAEDQLKTIEDSFFMSNADEDKSSFQNKKNIMKMLKDHRKSTAEKNAERIYKEFSTRDYQKYGISAEYVKKVIKLCWLMAVQDPPVCLGNEAKGYDKLDTDIFRPYTRTGITVSYTVWLPMFLHEGGPLLSKGVAQPFSTRRKSALTSRTKEHIYDTTESKWGPTLGGYTTRRSQNYEMGFKLQKNTKEEAVKSYASQPKGAWEPTHGYYNNKYHDQFHNPLSKSNYPYVNRSQLNTGVVTNAHTSHRSPNITHTKTQHEQSTVPTIMYRNDVHHKTFHFGDTAKVTKLPKI